MKATHNRWAWFAAIVAVGILADFSSKLAALRSLTPGALRPFLGDTIQWTLIFNRGAIFSLDPGDWIPGFPTALFFIGLTIVELMVVVWFYGRMDLTRSRLSPWGLALVAAGAGGNLVDRLLGRSGVVDFIRMDLGFPPFDPWPIFNIADIWITFGVALVLLDSGTGHDAPHPRQSDPSHGHRSIGTGGSQ